MKWSTRARGRSWELEYFTRNKKGRGLRDWNYKGKEIKTRMVVNTKRERAARGVTYSKHLSEFGLGMTPLLSLASTVPTLASASASVSTPTAALTVTILTSLQAGLKRQVLGLSCPRRCLLDGSEWPLKSD